MVTKKMSKLSRQEYVKRIKPRYLKSDKNEKGKILDELCLNTGYQRKYATRLLSAKTDLSKENVINKRKQGSWKYSAQDIHWLSKVWEIMDYPCGQRLEPVLSDIIDRLIKFKELDIPPDTVEKLKGIGSSTIDRRLKPYREKARTRKRKIQGTTKPGSLLKNQIPIRTSSWNEQRPGYCELDTVAHCGDSASGEYINSLTLVDVLFGWTENEAIMGKSEKHATRGIDNAKRRFPYRIAGIDPDNGGEFINYVLLDYCARNKIEFTRGRPYCKNDNAHVEQKNWTHVRKIFGYKRLETQKQMNLMNNLYYNELRLYQNFFLPNVKLVAKQRTGKHKEKIKRIYDKAKTPYQRIMEYQGDEISKEQKEKLKKQYEELNPAQLRRGILKKLDKLFKNKN